MTDLHQTFGRVKTLKLDPCEALSLGARGWDIALGTAPALACGKPLHLGSLGSNYCFERDREAEHVLHDTLESGAHFNGQRVVRLTSGFFGDTATADVRVAVQPQQAPVGGGAGEVGPRLPKLAVHSP